MTILIADDDKSILAALSILLDNENIPAESCTSPEDVLARIGEKSFDLALVDLNYRKDTTSGMEGLELISRMQEIDGQLPVVAMTGWGSIPVAVEAMRRGAVDFIEKPWQDNNRLLSLIRAQIRIREMSRRESLLNAENRLLRQQSGAQEPLVARSGAMRRLLEVAGRVARSELPVLITGENGTGKSLLAAWLHAHSPRAGGALVTVNMGGISDAAFESEMFGHVRGAFTDARSDRIGRVELADEGSLFLDEIANTPPAQQAKLLRLLEERQYEKLGSSKTVHSRARFISATNAELDVLVQEKGFRQDLLYRLNGVTLQLPPLRDRREDIPELAAHFLQRARRHCDSPARGLSGETLEVLAAYAWPGNIRELSHVIERAVLLTLDEEIQPRDLQLPATPAFPETVLASPLADSLEDMTLEQAEALLIRKALARHGRDVEKTAAALGLSRSALYRRLQKYGIS